MNTPVFDFVHRYEKNGALRFHMPGHKGIGTLGVEAFDITEINGADSLYEASGIIRESEKNASKLFGSETFYSAEGSSLAIRAMLYLAMLNAKSKGKKLSVAAGRNAHKTFLSAAALLDFNVEWIYPDENESYLSCRIDAKKLEKTFCGKELPDAVYVTSPDYLGNVSDIKSVSEFCRKNDILLLVDNAHGAYLKFLPDSQHPIDLGAHMCCDSAHKTLPVLTGGAYLHISENAPGMLLQQAKNALALFGSTSPSYIILESLDLANKYISNGYEKRLEEFIKNVQNLKSDLVEQGYTLTGSEPLKITDDTKKYGYKGYEFEEIRLENKIVPEFSDPDYTVFMLTPENGEDGLLILKKVLLSIPRKTEIAERMPFFSVCEKIITPREAVFSESEIIPASQSAGRVLAAASVGCPPAVPIVVCGEKINEEAVEIFKYYGIDKCSVVK